MKHCGLFEGVYRLFPKLMGGCRGVRMVEPLKRQGFVVQRREYFQQLLFPSEVILAAKNS
jgi:hypothetical protein